VSSFAFVLLLLFKKFRLSEVLARGLSPHLRLSFLP